MKKVIVLGSLNMDLTIQCVDLPKNGETINGSDFFVNPGGKGGNQAVAAAKLGAETHMIANIGNDVFGEQLLEALQGYGVHTKGVFRDAHETSGVAMIIRSHGDNRIILGNGANHTLPEAAFVEMLQKLARKDDIFLTQLENDYALVRNALRHAKQAGMDSDVYEHLDLIVVNQSECELLTGIYPSDEESCMEALLSFEARGVDALITLGTHGSMCNAFGRYLFVPAQKVETVDTTGAGDSFIGALCSCLSRDVDMKEAMEFATRVAALTVTRRGAQASIPYKKEVEHYFKEEN